MPAHRSRAARQPDRRLVPNTPLGPDPLASATDIAFAPNVTPRTYNDPLPALDASESIMFPPPAAGSLPPRRPGHSKKKPEDHIPRPPNAFILFRSSFIKSQHVSTEVETNHSTLSKIIGLTWQNLPNEERQIWHAKARIAQDEHKRKFPQYAFRPLHNKGRGVASEKRKVREVGPKDHKRCAKIAELLVNGKKGQELDAAVREFDEHHVPEVVTRFDTPITAKMFRRSFSAPLLVAADGQHSASPVYAGKPRSASSQSTRSTTPMSEHVLSLSPFPAAQELSFSNPSFDMFQFATEQVSSPTFDMNAFSFDATLPQCETLTQQVDPLDGSFNDGSCNMQSQLSIDTSILDDWARASSPLSCSTGSMPGTPCYIDMNSPPPDDFRSYSLDRTASTEYSMAKTFADLSQYSTFTGDNHPDEFAAELASTFPAFDLQYPRTRMMGADLDFPTFIASIPHYPL